MTSSTLAMMMLVSCLEMKNLKKSFNHEVHISLGLDLRHRNKAFLPQIQRQSRVMEGRLLIIQAQARYRSRPIIIYLPSTKDGSNNEEYWFENAAY